MNQINWGIIGCGNVTEHKSGPAFNQANGSRLVAVMRRDGDKAKDYAQRHQVPKWYNKAEALIADPDVNAVYIATPPDSHAHYTKLVAQAGKPVYVEKPMALNHAECHEMIEVCEQARVPLFVAYYRRCLPNYLQVKQLIDSQAIGAVRLVSIQLWRALQPDEQFPHSWPWRVIPEKAGGGHFVDLASHQLDFLDFLLGPIAHVQGISTNQAGVYPAEDSVCASFSWTSGVIGSGTWVFSTHTSCERDIVEITGTAGCIRFSTYGHDVPIRLETEQGVQEFSPEMPDHIQQPLIESICAELQGCGSCPSTGVTAARTSWAMDEILKDRC